MSTQTTPRITEVGVVMVPVSDQDAAIEFFRDKLGFELRGDIAYGNGDRWVEVAPPGATTRVALVRPGSGEGVGTEARVAFATEDVDADHALLRERGVDVDETVMRMGDPVPPMFWFRDGDGNKFLLVQSS